MDTNYLEEAFKKLSLLEDDFDISVDAGKVDELKSFIEDDVDDIPEEEIIDVHATKESELQDNYIGKVILECECCHSRIYKDEEEVIIDEDSGLANVDEQCPVCNNELGYTVIGKIEPFNKDREIEADEVEEVEELPEDDVEFEESLEDRIARKHLLESDDVCPVCGKNPCECESLEECGDLEECSDLEEARKAGPNGVMNTVIIWATKPLESTGLPLVTWDFYDVKKPETLDKAIESGKISSQVWGPHKAAEYATMTLEKFKELVEGHDYDQALSRYMLMNGHPVNESLEEEFEDPSRVGVDPDVSVEDDIKLETPQDNPVNEDPSVLDLKEDFKEVEIKTDDQKLEMTSDENGKVTVTTEPLEEEVAEDEVVDSITTEPDDAEVGPEEIVPLTSEEEAKIEANTEEPAEAPVEELPDEEVISDEEVVEEEPADEDEEELDVDEFDEKAFDEMGESYMRKVYGNVKDYTTTHINENAGSVIIEGLITFESGKQKDTKFVFENASISKRGKLVFEGYNKTFTKANKAFMIRGSLVDKKYIPESLIYNYKVKQLNESTGEADTYRVYGRIKRK